MGVALHKDLVQVQLYAQGTGKSIEGRVVKIVKRARQQIVGTYQKTRRFGFVIPDDLKIQRDIFIPENQHKKARAGEKVVVKLLHWHDERANPEGEVVEVLGFAHDPGVDVMSVMKAHDLSTKFPRQVEDEANLVPTKITKEELARRLDLRDEICFTIDPDDAKDFDDAISIEELENGNLRLGVHIADVSHYVQPGSKMVEEALKRGTSVYLVDRVVPMLPEKISNQICSLRPHEDRLAFSCIMEVTLKGEVHDYKIAESVIHSKKRFTYEDVQGIIENPKSKVPFSYQLKLSHKLSKTLIKKRQQQGSLDFNMSEVKVKLNDDGEPIAINRVERKDSNRLVEEFMLLANQTVTEHVTLKLGESGRVPPFIFRIHEPPAYEKMDDFRKFVKTLGFPIDPNKEVDGKLLGDYLMKLEGKPEQNIIENLLLRSMMKAKYAIDNAGHFGLAFKNYTHFTSPIRRYPDLEVHRLLKEYQTPFDFSQMKRKKARLSKVAKGSSERELVALEAERESIKLKKVEYMQRHHGEEFDGIISGVVPFGIFIEISEFLVEGLVHISDLDGDYYEYEEKNHRLIGQRNGNTYRLGDSVRVKVVRVDIDERVIDFILAKPKEEETREASKRRYSKRN